MPIPSFTLNTRCLTLVFATSIALVACGGGPGNSQQQTSNAATPAASRSNASTDKNAYPVFPNADAGADPSVPAE